ncbi:MAG: orotidine 5'-phosphate decarboxylase [Myxococcales bacterium]|nr:orotidine 5'-phosphate decarboxylase [Myxococcales bacterium]
MTWLLPQAYSLIPACDMPFARFETFVSATAHHEAISAYKVGFVLGLEVGLPRVVEIVRRYTDKPVIYDHQKAATDIPATGKPFAQVLKRAGVDIGILFPQAGPATMRAWIEALREEEVGVMVGGWMSHPNYIQSQGGYLADEAIVSLYREAAKLGVTDYVMPGNQPDVIQRLRGVVVEEGIEPALYMPGFVAQGGSLRAAAEVSGPRWHGIVGRGIYEAADPIAAIDALWAQLQAAMQPTSSNDL